MKQTGIMLAAVLFMAVGMNCAGASQQQPTTTGTQAAVPAPVRPPAPAPAYTPAAAPAAPTATAAKTSTVDELDAAIRDASDCLNDNIPKESKIVILNIESNSANLSEYIIDELIANAINDKNFSVVDRRQLDAIQSEQKFQMSGAVDDKDALAIGKFFGAQTIVSGAMREMGGRYRMAIRALAVQTAVMQSQCNQTITASAAITDLVSSGGSRPTSGGATTSGRTTQAATAPATAPRTTPAASAIKGTPVQGNNLTEKLDWLQENAESGGNYLIELNANETIAPQTLAYEGKSKITITLAGVGTNRSVFLSANGSMFTINDVTLVLDNNVTLQGRSQNTKPLVHINGGTLKMNAESAITGNSNITGNDKKGGAVYANPGTVTMNGGTIYENTAGDGGGIFMKSGTFTMNDGTITSNTVSSNGGGVYLGENVTFNMKEGTISDNTANANGGGVYVYKSTFNMRGGTISGNTAGKDGGGVCAEERPTFNISGGNITGNTAGNNGGGVWLHRYSAIFNKGGGIITGSNDANSGNRALSGQKGGHAIYARDLTRKETTAGQGVNLSYRGDYNFAAIKSSGAWDKDE